MPYWPSSQNDVDLGLTPLCLPRHCNSFVFLHKVKFPLWPDFDLPEKYGISPSKSRNLRLTSSDGVSIGAWHILPDQYHRNHQPSPLSSAPRGIPEEVYDQAFRDRPTVIYLHGNAANRAAPFRIASYAQFTARLQANVLAIDYRGFGDSEGSPSEAGLVRDARAAWDFVQSRKKGQRSTSSPAGEGIVIIGQSLGTGVASQLTRELSEEGTPPQATVLIAPYRSLRKLVAGYRLGFVPVLAPILYIPFFERILDRMMHTTFASDEALPGLYAALAAQPKPASGPDRSWPHLVIAHATNDGTIPYSHGELLFESLAHAEAERRQTRRLSRDSGSNSDAAGTTPGADSADGLFGAGEALVEAMGAALGNVSLQDSLLSPDLIKAAGVQTKVIPKWARIERFAVELGGGEAEGSREGPGVTLIRTEHGGHNSIGEGVIDVIRDVTGLEPRISWVEVRRRGYEWDQA